MSTEKKNFGLKINIEFLDLIQDRKVIKNYVFSKNVSE